MVFGQQLACHGGDVTAHMWLVKKGRKALLLAKGSPDAPLAKRLEQNVEVGSWLAQARLTAKG